MKILSKEYVYEYGVDSEEIGYDDVHGTHVIMDTQIPFTGLLYYKYDDGDLGSYCFYKDGYEDGDEVIFYGDGIVMEWNSYDRKTGSGTYRTYYENEVLMSELKVEKNHKEYRIWGENGNRIEEKEDPTGDDVRRMDKIVNKKPRFY